MDFRNGFVILECILTTFEEYIIFETAGAVAKIGLAWAYKQSNRSNLNQVKLVQICETL